MMKMAGIRGSGGMPARLHTERIGPRPPARIPGPNVGQPRTVTRAMKDGGLVCSHDKAALGGGRKSYKK